MAATMEFNKANIALLSSSPLLSIDAQIAHRRLEEGYCLKYTHCLVDNLKLVAADMFACPQCRDWALEMWAPKKVPALR
jgi:hypothetical protein